MLSKSEPEEGTMLIQVQFLRSCSSRAFTTSAIPRDPAPHSRESVNAASAPPKDASQFAPRDWDFWLGCRSDSKVGSQWDAYIPESLLPQITILR